MFFYFADGDQHPSAQEHRHAAESVPTEQLGTVSFLISCSPSVQVSFERGVALLHSFEYDTAQTQFREIEQDDPTCAMAYWGEAMSLYRQLWDRPSASSLNAGWKLVQRAQAAGPKTDRERGYINAAAAFYRPDAHMTYDARQAAYLGALESLYYLFPNDDEAAVSYALALIASPHSNNHDLAYRKKAVGLLTAVFAKDPDHPGVTHYLIHACDNPEMAKEALPAARRYAQIAPSSPHALHMPSHIFARLGLWQDDIESNLKSKAAAEKHGDTAARIHAMDFLEYAYLQVGNTGQAKKIEAEALTVQKRDFEKGMEDSYFYVQTHFPALLLLETRDWKGVESLQAPAHSDAVPDLQSIVYWAQAIAAGHLRNVSAARNAVGKYDLALAAVKKTTFSYVTAQMTTPRDEVRSWLEFAEGDKTGAVRLLKLVAAKQDKAGKSEVAIPAREMLADMLLELGQPQQALAQYVLSLKTDPHRFNGLYGAGHAAELCHRDDLARSYYQQLLANCASMTESTRPELADAREYLSRKPSN